MHVLADGVCTTCTPHVLVDGVCTTCTVARFDPMEPRDPHSGKWSGGALEDALKLAGKIDLGPDEHLVGSSKIDGHNGGIRMALTRQRGEPMLRLGLGSEGYGEDEHGQPSWDGGPSPAGHFNGTAKLDQHGMGRLTDRLRPALAEAADRAKAENKAWDEIEGHPKPSPERLAKLRQITDRTEPITFTDGVIPGAWGDVHYSVLLDDVSSGVQIMLGVKPSGAPEDWGKTQDWEGRFSPAEIQKFLRQLDQYRQS